MSCISELLQHQRLRAHDSLRDTASWIPAIQWSYSRHPKQGCHLHNGVPTPNESSQCGKPKIFDFQSWCTLRSPTAMWVQMKKSTKSYSLLELNWQSRMPQFQLPLAPRTSFLSCWVSSRSRADKKAAQPSQNPPRTTNTLVVSEEGSAQSWQGFRDAEVEIASESGGVSWGREVDEATRC